MIVDRSASLARRSFGRQGLRGFGALWLATSATNLADGLVQLTLPILAARATSAPAAVAAVGVAATTPWLLFALPVGVLADRADRRMLMLGANALRAAALLLLASLVITEAMSLPALYGVAFILGTAETIADTTAQSILPTVVEGKRLERANARLIGAQTVANQFVGPPLGGLLIAASAALAIGTSAGLYLVAVPLLWLLRGAFRPAPTGSLRLRQDIEAGLRFLAGHRLLRTLALFVFVMNVGWGAWYALLVLYAVAPGPLGLSEAGYGLLLTAMGVGGVLGTTVAVPLQRLIGSRWAIAADLLGTVTMLGMPALTTNPWLIAASIIGGGAGSAMWSIVVTSIRQQAAPDAMLGRVTSAFRLCGFAGPTLGAAAGGALAEVVGLRPVFAACAVLSTLLLIPFIRIVTDTELRSARQTPRPDAIWEGGIR
ncbi:MAG TPA: MFS transporter [Thermomicrobiales bacterium]|nr:MFS transporter [Thermomicrobiales bacterium]